MKTQLSFRSLYGKEILSWLVLTVAILLFACTLTFAQSGEKTEGKIHIRLEKDENGKTTRIDTTFDIRDMEKAQEFMEELNEDTPHPPVPPREPGQSFRYHFHTDPLDESDEGEFREEMEQLKADMRGLKKRLNEMRLEMYADSDFAFAIPPMPPSWNSGDWPHFDKEWKGDAHCLRIFSDSTGSSDKVIILDGADGEEIEKALKESDGTRVIIIRRGDKKSGDTGKKESEKSGKPEKSKGNAGKLDAMNLEYYPNPGNGRFTLSFSLEKKGDTTVRIFDPAGKEVYAETLKDFSGEYLNRLDISQKGKGTYLLKITQDGKSVSRKVVVE